MTDTSVHELRFAVPRTIGITAIVAVVGAIAAAAVAYATMVSDISALKKAKDQAEAAAAATAATIAAIDKRTAGMEVDIAWIRAALAPNAPLPRPRP